MVLTVSGPGHTECLGSLVYPYAIPFRSERLTALESMNGNNPALRYCPLYKAPFKLRSGCRSRDISHNHNRHHPHSPVDTMSSDDPRPVKRARKKTESDHTADAESSPVDHIFITEGAIKKQAKKPPLSCAECRR